MQIAPKRYFKGSFPCLWKCFFCAKYRSFSPFKDGSSAAGAIGKRVKKIVAQNPRVFFF